MNESETESKFVYECASEYVNMVDDEQFPELPLLGLRHREKMKSLFTNHMDAGDIEGHEMRRREAHGKSGMDNHNSEEDKAGAGGKVGELPHEDVNVISSRDTQVLDEYLEKRYVKRGNRALYKPEFHIEISDLKDTNRVSEMKMADRPKEKDKTKEQKGWEDISHFTNSKDLYMLNSNQIRICEYFVEDKDEEELGEDEEEVDRIEQVQVRPFKKRRRRNQVKRREARGGRYKLEDKKEYVAKVIMKGDEPSLQVEPMPVKKEIWGFGKVGGGQDRGDDKNKGGETYAILYDSGNLSRSLVSVGFIKKLSRQMGRRIELEKYEQVVKGVGGAKIELVGQVKASLALSIPGFSRLFYFRPIVSTGRMAHINVSLAEMKEHEVSLHLLKNMTVLEDARTKDKTRLFDRENLYGQSVHQLENEQVVKIVNRLRGQPAADLAERDLIDLSKVESAVKLKLREGEVLSEEGGNMRFYESIDEAWEQDNRLIEATEREGTYPGNWRKDLLAARQMRAGMRVQSLRPVSSTVIEPNSHLYIPCKVKTNFGQNYFVHPCADTILEAGGALVTPSINQMRDPRGLAHVSVLNLTDHKYHLGKNDVIGYLELIDENEGKWEEVEREVDVEKGGGGGKNRSDKHTMYVKEQPPERELMRSDGWSHPPTVHQMEYEVGGHEIPSQSMYVKGNPPEVEGGVGGPDHMIGSCGTGLEAEPIRSNGSAIKPERVEDKGTKRGQVLGSVGVSPNRISVFEEQRKKENKSGFFLLAEDGSIQDHVGDERKDKKRKFWSNGVDVSDNPIRWESESRLCVDTRREVEERHKTDMRQAGQTNETSLNKRHGLKTFTKQPKLNVKEVLAEKAREVRAGDRGLFIRGEIREGQLQVNTDKDRQLIKEEEERELRKRYLCQLDKEELKQFLEKETKVNEIEYLQDKPIMKQLLVNIMMENYQAFTPSPSHPLYRYEAGLCKQLVYHPELKPEHRHKIFATKMQTFAPDDERELGVILRSWVRAGILRKQDISDPDTRSPHNHRIILVRKKPVTEQQGSNETNDTGETGETRGARPGAGILPEMNRPRRLVLDLRDLNQCSITHKHYMASVHEHISMLERGSLFNSVDLDNFFSSIPCSDLASKLLSFHCSHGSFSYLRLCQGWSSSPGVASALGARLTSVLRRDTLALFCDDGLQVGRRRQIGEKVVRSMERFGDLVGAMVEDMGGPEHGVESRDRCATYNAQDTGRQTKETGLNKTTEHMSSKMDHRNIGQLRKHDEKNSHKFSPLDQNFSDKEDDEGPLKWITPGIDLLIKFKDLLQAIVKFGLKIAGSKLRLMASSVDYLGFRIGQEGIKMQPRYLSTLAKYEVPKSSTVLKNFLGYVQYFACQAPILHRYTARLYDAANRKMPAGEAWSLNKEEIEDFYRAKLCFLRSEGLGFPELSDLDQNPLRLWNDFSSLSLASLLTQVQRDKLGNYKETLIGVYGRKCPKALQSASSAVGESHALCFGLIKFKGLLQLSIFDLFCDHLNLKFLNQWQHLRGIYFRLYQQITQYVFRMFTVSSGEMLACDLISRIEHEDMTSEEKEALGLGLPGDGVYDNDMEAKHDHGNDLEHGIKSHWKNTTQHYLIGAREEEGRKEMKQEPGEKRNVHFVGEMIDGGWRDGSISEREFLGGREYWDSDGQTVEDRASFNCEGHSDLKRRNSSQTMDTKHIDRQGGEVILVCDEFLGNRNCSHIKWRFPLEPDKDKIYQFVCVHKRYKSQVIASLGPSGENLFRSISRYELIKEQRNDRDLVKAMYFLKNGWPSLKNFKQIYPTEILMELFYNREKLSRSVDGLMVMGRDRQEYALEERTIIPKSLLFHVFSLAHLSSSSFHNSITNTALAINFRFFVPQLTTVLRYFLARCVTCLQLWHKPNRLRRMPTNVPNFIRSQARFNDKIFLDLSGSLVTSHINGFRYFLLIIDRFSLFIEAVPLRTVHSEEVKMAFLTGWLSRYGPSSVSISDPGSQFCSKPFRKMLSELNLLHKYSNTSIPRAEMAEVGIARLKKGLKQCLASCRDHSEWPLALMMAKYAHNQKICQSTMVAPAELALGEMPKLDLSWISKPVSRLVVGDSFQKDKLTAMPDHEKRKEDARRAIWTNGQVKFPTATIFHGDKLNLDLTRLRKNDPVRLMMQEEPKDNSFVNSSLCKYFLRAGLASMISDNQLMVYGRSRSALSKAKNELYPLTQDDVGKQVFRYNPIPRSFKQEAGRLSAAWQGPLVVSVVYNEILCVVEGLIRGRHVAYRTPLDHLRVYHDFQLNDLPACSEDQVQDEVEMKEKGEEKEEDGEDEGEAGDDEEDDQEEEKEETVQYAEERDLNQVSPYLNKREVPNSRFLYVETIEKAPNLDKQCEELLRLPDADIICIDPVAELRKLGDGEAIKEIIKGIQEEGEDEKLVFHNMMDMEREVRTRSEKSKLMDLMLDEKEAMLTSANRNYTEEEGAEENQTKEEERRLIISGGGEERDQNHEEDYTKEQEEVEEEESRKEDHFGEEEEERRSEAEQEEREEEEDEKEEDKEEDEGEEGFETAGEEETEVRNESDPPREVYTEGEEEKDEEELPQQDLTEKEKKREKSKKLPPRESWITRKDRKGGEGGGGQGEEVEEDKEEEEEEDKPVRLVSLAKTVKKRLTGHLTDGNYWKTPLGERRKKK